MITGYALFRIYQTTKLHFTTSYDAIKYGNKSSSITIERFESRKDFGRFEGWARKIQTKHEALYLCVFNFVNNNPNWIYDDFDGVREVYLKTKGYFGALRYNFKNELEMLQTIQNDKDVKFSDMIVETKSGSKPPLLQLILRKSLSREFICILNNKFGFIDGWKLKYDNDPLVKKELHILTKYTGFVNILIREING